MPVNEELYTMCQQKFNEEVWLPFNNLCNIEHDEMGREKRQALIFGAGLATEYIVTTIVESVRGWFRGEQEQSDQQRINIIDAEMAGLKKHTSEIYLIQKAQNNALKILSQQVTTNTKRIGELAKMYPQQAWMTAGVQYDINHAAENLHIVKHNLKNGKISPELGAFLKISDFQNIDQESSLLENCKVLKPGVIRMQFTTREIDRKTHILEADPFAIYSNLTTTPCLYEYVGDRYVIHNTTANCTKSVPIVTGDRYQIASCQEKDREFVTKIPSWHEKFCLKDLNHIAPVKQVKYTRKNFHFYCINNNLTLNGEARKCPPFVFKIPRNVQWQLGNDKSDTTTTYLNIHTVAEHYPDNVTDNWVQDPQKETSAELLSKIAELQKITNQLNPGLITLSDTAKQVIYLKRNNDMILISLATIGGVTIILFFGVSIYYGRNVCKNRKLPPPSKELYMGQKEEIHQHYNVLDTTSRL